MAYGTNRPSRTRWLLAAIALMAAAGPNSLSAGPGEPGAASAPRRSDLSHVQPGVFAEALGMDAARIFEFVRDRVGHESYRGCLRGPRGTLLAMAGNSADRASLLAELLRLAGEGTRFARGILPETDATRLVSAMRSEREQGTGTPGAEATSQPVGVEPFRDALRRSVRRDYPLVRDALVKANLAPTGPAGAGDRVLVEEVRDHFWVQWKRGETWVDLDPSFPDAKTGSAFAKVAETFERFPEDLMHRVQVRVMVEEATGESIATRNVLTFDATAPELSGADLVLTHQPEGWKGPVKDVAGALDAGIAQTGAILPVLVSDRGCAAGEPFRMRAPDGVAGVGDRLRGEGTRRKSAIAIAEYLEMEFTGPGGTGETVVRAIFDRIGKAGRRAAKVPEPDAVKRALERPAPVDPSNRLYGLFFTTGGIHPLHLLELSDAQDPTASPAADVRQTLRRFNVAVTALSDGLLRRIRGSDGTAIRCYPVTPRLLITDVGGGSPPGITVDLRRTGVRVVAANAAAREVFLAHVLRGVVEGALERVAVEQVAGSREAPVAAMSTSLVFETAIGEGVPVSVLGKEPRGDGASADALAWLAEDLDRGFLAVVPDRAVQVGGGKRLAWWRVHPTSGETTAVTDEGLHGSGTETPAQYTVVTTETRVGTAYYVASREGGMVFLRGPLFNPQDLARIMAGFMAANADLVRNPNWLSLVWP